MGPLVVVPGAGMADLVRVPVAVGRVEVLVAAGLVEVMVESSSLMCLRNLAEMHPELFVLTVSSGL